MWGKMRPLTLIASVITVVCADSAYNPASFDFGSQTDEPVVSEVTKTDPYTNGEAQEVFSETTVVHSTTKAHCASYLCSSRHKKESAEAYLESGCTGSFTDYRSDSSTSSSTSDLTDLSTVADTTTNGRGVSTSMLVAVSSACGAVALVAGYIAGQQEGEALGYSGDERSPLLQSNKGGRL